ncbi:MAG: hypothetical protein ACYC2P_13460, partial [Paludibacteraceae bacterium]
MKPTTSFVSIDSLKRESGVPEDLTIYLDYPIQNVTEVTLEHFACYNTIYNVDITNNLFPFSDGTNRSVSVTPGNYAIN